MHLIPQNIKDRIFNIFLYFIMINVIIVTLYPFWNCLVGSLNEGFDYIKGGVYFFPRKFTLENYKIVLRDDVIMSSYRVTILRTIIGTATHVIFTAVFAYAYSRKILKGKTFYMIFCLITMYFGGGLIPQYILYKQLNILNTFWVYIIPGLLSFWHVIILQAFFRGIPDSLSESAMMDGANEYVICWKIIMPLAKPVLAAIALFTGVGHWNSYMDSMMFTTSKSLQTVQVYLMRIIKTQEMATQMANEAGQDILDGGGKVNAVTIQLATMMVTTIPIIFIYPFMQKYFVKGMMVGAIKG